jgi:hypothetical protein
MVPGTAVVTPITIKNVGTVSAATFTLKAGSNCTQTNNGSANGSATDLCAKLAVVITSGGTTIFNGTAASLAATSATPIAIPAPLVPVAAGTTIPISVSVTLDPAAGANYQGLAASLPLTWTFVS